MDVSINLTQVVQNVEITINFGASISLPETIVYSDDVDSIVRVTAAEYAALPTPRDSRIMYIQIG